MLGYKIISVCSDQMKVKIILCNRSWLTALSPDVVQIRLLLAYELSRERNSEMKEQLLLLKENTVDFLLQSQNCGCSRLSQVASFKAPHSSKRQKKISLFLYELYSNTSSSGEVCQLGRSQLSGVSSAINHVYLFTSTALIRSQRHCFKAKVRAAFREPTLPSPELWISYRIIFCNVGKFECV